MPDLTIAAMTDEVHDLNTAKGWREQPVSLREHAALINSEVGEMLDAWRRWGLDDATDNRPCETVADVCVTHKRHHTQCGLPKPEGVGAEIADVLIRTVDACDALGRNLHANVALADVAPLDPPPDVVSFGDHCDWLSDLIHNFKNDTITGGPWLLRGIAAVADRYKIDLAAEYQQKMAHNWTRPHRHGGKRL